MIRNYFSYRVLRNISNALFFAIIATIVIISFAYYKIFATNLIQESYSSFSKAIKGVSHSTDIFYDEVVSVMSHLTFNDSNIKHIMFQNEHSRLIEYNGVQTMKNLKVSYPYIEYLAVYNQKMDNLTSTIGLNSSTTKKLKDIVNINYTQNGISSNPIAINTITTAPSLARRNTVTMIMYSPLSKKNQKGAILLGINCEYFQKLFSNMDTGDSESIIVLDKNGLIISHPDKSLLLQDYSENQIFKQTLPNKGKTGYFIGNLNNSKMLFNYIKNVKSGWTFLSMTPYEKVLLKSNSMLKETILVAVAILNIGIIISYIAAMKIFKPIKWLLKKFNYNPDDSTMSNSNELIFLDNEFEKLNLNVQLTEPLIRSEVIRDLLKLQSTSSEYANQDKIEAMFKSPFYIVILLTIDNKEVFNMKPTKEQSYISYTLCSLASEILKKDYAIADPVSINTSTVAVILHLSDGRQPNSLIHSLDRLTNGMMEICQQSVSIAISSIVDSIYAITDAYEEATALIKEQFFRGYGSIIASNESSKRQYIAYPKKLEGLLLNAIKKSDENQISNIADQLKSIIENTTYEYAITHVTRIVTCALSDSLKTLPDIDVRTFHNFIWSLYNTETLEEVMQKLKRFCAEIAVNFEPKAIKSSSPFVEKAIRLAYLKYNDPNFSINAVSADLEISAAYFNRVFKNEKGIAYSEYLNRIRLTKAKELLEQTDESIPNICNKVGITNTSYFYTLFKKLYGTTPQQCRLNLRDSQIITEF